jgi:hypothetical protein
MINLGAIGRILLYVYEKFPRVDRLSRDQHGDLTRWFSLIAFA